MSPFSTLVAEDIEVLRLSQAQMADKKREDGDRAESRADGERQREEAEMSADRGQNDEEEEEDSSEQVSALPLSWSMLSLSSQPSGSSEHASLQGNYLSPTTTV